MIIGPDLEKVLINIDTSIKYDLAMLLVEATIPIWEDYAKDPENLSYFDGVGGSYYIRYEDTSGNYQVLEKDIANRSTKILQEEKAKPGNQVDVLQELCVKVKAHIDAINIWDDWQPEQVEYTLYAIYNFIQLYQGKFKGNEDIELNHIIKFAGDALVTSKHKTLDELLTSLYANSRYTQKETEKPDDAAG